ncbi:hypothetical protein MW290_11060 [Aquincola tertiaricarbonis]|uniref:Peptidase M20 n=1 Tax=Aquincola tertiaricarbonis TaxID=391953 RepID=A0ABY4S0U6_AQUTE|nr:hypothetical protein [Aquincola tertiaricarbonis]URI06448.1 hypothetical protein MW290_11060 [Aquincola tertiaricarbonis]
MKRFLRTLALAGLAAASLSVQAQQTGLVRIEFQGPGGHSSSNYGRTSALHAAGRTAILMQQNLPAGSYLIMNLTGGNSVNSIASDGLIEVRLTAANAPAYQSLVAALTELANAGATAENNFRGVKVGDLTAGAPAWIRASVR